MKKEKSRREITEELSGLLESHIDPKRDTRVYWAKEVTFDYATGHAVRVDYMLFKPVNNTVSGIEKGDFWCYEVKSSVEDFRSGHGLNFIGDYNYIVMPEKVYETVCIKHRRKKDEKKSSRSIGGSYGSWYVSWMRQFRKPG